MNGLSEVELIASDASLSILAKHIVNGALIGAHQGTRRGTGSEFSQYRSYQPGDDIRQIDWKMFARSDRYYIKESETETSITIRIFLDASLSMKYEENNYSRLRYASVVAATLATLGYQQGDAIALHIVNDKNRIDVKEKRGKVHLNRLIHNIESAECAGNWPEDADWLIDCMNSHQSELWFVCSDFLDEIEPWKKFVQMCQTFGNEVNFIQILGEKEKNLSFDDVVTVQDPESNKQLSIRAKAVREQYLKNLHAYLAELKDTLAGAKFNYDSISMNTPVSEALRDILQQRMRLR